MSAAKRFSFTQGSIDALPPARTRDYYHDSQIRGLQLQVTALGAKTFYVYRRVRGKPTRIRLGAYPDLKPGKARSLAQRVLGQIAAGADPAAERRAERARGLTLGEVFVEFLRVRALKPKTAYDYERVLHRAFADWIERPVTGISKDHVAQRFTRLSRHHGPADANLAMRVLRAVLNFAAANYEDSEGRSLILENPVKRLSDTRAWHRIKRRQTAIHKADLPAWMAAVESLRADPEPIATTVADWLTLLLFTGLRRREGLDLRWQDVELRGGTLTIPEPKNHEPHQLPLPECICELLSRRRREHPEAAYVFQSETRPGPVTEPRAYLRRVIERSGITFTPHDLRRTFTTVAESIEVSPYALKRLLNHKMSQDVTAGYIVTDVERLRPPMQRIADCLHESAEQAPETDAKEASR